MPWYGTKKKTIPIRIRQDKRLMNRTVLAFPRPWRILPRRLETNIKGQTQLRRRIKYPARGLEKRISPIKSPETRKITVKMKPKSSPYRTAFSVAWETFFFSPFEVASDTAGSRSTDREPVMTLGKKITDKDIPERTP